MRFFERSIRNRLMVFLLAATIIPIVTSMIITYLYTKESLKNDTIQENSFLISQAKNNIENHLSIVESASLSVYNNLSNERSLYHIISTGQSDRSAERDIHVYLSNLSNMVKEIHQVYLYVEKSNKSYAVINKLLKKGDGYRLDYLGDFTTPTIEPTHYSHTYGFSEFPYNETQWVYTFHRPIFLTPLSDQIGVLSLDVRLDMLQEISKDLYTPNEEEIYIVDDQKRIIFAHDENQIGSELQVGWMDILTEADQQSGYFEWEDGINVYHKLDNEFAHWTIVKRIPYSILYQDARRLTLINSFVFSIFLIIVIIATLSISVRFTSPIKKLIKSINQIQIGQLQTTIDTSGKDEIGILARRMDSMMQTINNLILKEYRLEIANKTNQLKALQAQINPHFLNNVLQSIGTLALQRQAPDIYKLVSSLGKMMNYNMNTQESVIPLSKEIDYVKAYLDLQKQRFGEKLKTVYMIEEATLQIVVPKMILQPLVENSFKHGFKNSMRKDAVIHIETQLKRDKLTVIIQDNGEGMEESRRKELQMHLDTPGTNVVEGSIGLTNVLSRLRLTFGEEATLRLSSLPQGLRVEMDIPIRKGAEQSGQESNKAAESRIYPSKSHDH